MGLNRCLLVFVGGGAGAVLRYAVGMAISQSFGERYGKFPLGTVVINVSGSFVIGLLMTLMTERFVIHPNWRLLWVVGVLGGYTTFSSFEYETLDAARAGYPWIALLNVVVSVAAGYAAVWLGWALARGQLFAK